MGVYPLRPMSGRSLAPVLVAAAAVLTLAVTSAWPKADTGAKQPVRVKGTVTLADGGAAVGGVIGLGGRAAFGPVQYGRFKFAVDDLPPGDYDVTYGKGNLVATRVVHVSAGQREVEVSLHVGAEPAVEGRVVSDELPHGFPGAEISVRGPILPGRDLMWTLYAGEDGAFLLDGKTLKGCKIQATLPYHRPSEWVQIKPPFPMEVTLKVQPDTVILGRVMEAGGDRPVANAVVAFASSHTYGSTTADEQGHFALTGLEAGEFWLETYARMFSREGAALTLEKGRPVLGFVLRLHAMAYEPVHGRVLGPDGKTGVARAKLSFQQPSGPFVPGREAARAFSRLLLGPDIVYSAVTDELGNYYVKLPVPPVLGEPTAPWKVALEVEGYLKRTYWMHLNAEASGPGGTPPVFDFQVFHGGHLSGIVSPGPDGRLPQDAVAQLGVGVKTLGAPDLEAGTAFDARVSSETGRFDFGLVEPGEHTLVIRDRGRELVKTKVTVKEGEALEINVLLPG